MGVWNCLCLKESISLDSSITGVTFKSQFYYYYINTAAISTDYGGWFSVRRSATPRPCHSNYATSTSCRLAEKRFQDCNLCVKMYRRWRRFGLFTRTLCAVENSRSPRWLDVSSCHEFRHQSDRNVCILRAHCVEWGCKFSRNLIFLKIFLKEISAKTWKIWRL